MKHGRAAGSPNRKCKKTKRTSHDVPEGDGPVDAGRRKRQYACRACNRKPGPMVEWGEVEVKANQTQVPVGTACKQCSQLWAECFIYMVWDEFADWACTEDVACANLRCPACSVARPGQRARGGFGSFCGIESLQVPLPPPLKRKKKKHYSEESRPERQGLGWELDTA